jgi:uncharacterized membrane protein YoaK (UPF0700 family)
MVNVVAFLALSTFVSHHTGTLSKVGLGFGEGEFGDALACVLLVMAFTGGSAVCGFLIRKDNVHLGLSLYDFGLLTETGLLVAASLTAEDEAAKYFAAAACGLQNGMATHWGSAVLRTTHVTGLFTDVGLLVGKLTRKSCVRRSDAASKAQWADDLSKLSLLLSLALAFFVGIYAGAGLYNKMKQYAFFVPAAITGVGGLGCLVYRVAVLRQHLFSDMEPELEVEPVVPAEALGDETIPLSPSKRRNARGKLAPLSPSARSGSGGVQTPESKVSNDFQV